MNVVKFFVPILMLLVVGCSKNECNPNPIKDCVTTLELNPVCGCDGVTYGNPGAAHCNGINDYTMGKCPIDLNSILGQWKFLGYKSEGAAINKNNSTHNYDMNINFTADVRDDIYILTGKSSINLIGGTFDITNKNTINMSISYSTKIAGDEAATNYEQKYSHFLNNTAAQYYISGNYLEIHSSISNWEDANQTKSDVLIFKKD